MYKFLLHPNITYKFLLYTSSQHHNSLLSQLPVTSQHYIQFPNITNSNNKSRTTSSQHKIAERYIYIYIYIYIQVLYITKNIQEEFFYIQNCPQTTTGSKQQHHVCVNKNIYTNVCVYNMLRMSSVSFASILNRNAFLSTLW